MAQKLNPFSSRQFIDANGDPYSGAQLFVYTAGSSTKTTVTKDSAGISAHANPIILNSKGEPGDGAGAAQAIWQAEGVSVKLVLAPSDDTDPPVTAIESWDNIAGINDTTVTIDQWVSGAAPTYISATSFSLVGDQTSDFHVGRRIKTTNTGGTIYSTITDTAYTSLTTVTVENDSGALDSGLSAVSYGLISSTNTSDPAGTKYGEYTFNNTVTFSKGADVASASALTLGNDGNYFDVTGTTTITSIAAVGVGTVIKLQFDGILTLTHHATDLILPGGVNITTAAGDEVEFVEYASGDWRCTSYVRSSGRPVVTDLILLNSGTVSAAATLDIVMTAYTDYPNKLLIIDSFIPATDGSSLSGQVSTDGGSTFDSGAANYRYARRNLNSTGTASDTGGTDTGIQIASAVGSSAGEPGVSAKITMFNTTKTDAQGMFLSEATFNDGTPRTVLQTISSHRVASQDTDAFRLLFSSGNIASGRWALYGFGE